MKTQFINTMPVLPSANIERDVAWYQQQLGLTVFRKDPMYAVLFRENFCLHLQWHAGTENDPLGGGSVVRVQVSPLGPLFDEMVARGTVGSDKLRQNTPWGTNEFGFNDLNSNAIFFMEDVVVNHGIL